MSDTSPPDPLAYEFRKLILDRDLYRCARDGGQLTVEVHRRKNVAVHATFPGRWLCLSLWLWPDYEERILGQHLGVVEGQLTVTAAPAGKDVWPEGVEACWLAQTLAYEPGSRDPFHLRTECIVSYGGELARHQDPLVAFHKIERKFQEALAPHEGMKQCIHCYRFWSTHEHVYGDQCPRCLQRQS